MSRTKTIWKYELPLSPKVLLRMPRASKILFAAAQRGTICLWASVYPEFEEEDRSFLLVGTGNSIPEGLHEYIGTVQIDPFVWHIFETKREVA